MPPRLVVVTIVVAWLATVGWLIGERWKKPTERPPFAIDLADEVAPQHASWLVYHDGKQVGHAETRIAPRKDGTFELTTRLRDMKLSHGDVELRIPLIAVTRVVSHDGDLRTLDAKALMNFQGPGLTGHAEVSVRGRAVAAEFLGDRTFDAGDGPTIEPLDPVPLGAATSFASLEPLHKYPPLRIGQTWRLSQVDSVSEMLTTAFRQGVTRKTGIVLRAPDTPKEVRARVTADTEVIVHRERSYICRIIVFEADRVIARIWIDVNDGKVIRQEASALDQLLVLQRD